jgi:hypothetical protein
MNDWIYISLRQLAEGGRGRTVNLTHRNKKKEDNFLSSFFVFEL